MQSPDEFPRPSRLGIAFRAGVLLLPIVLFLVLALVLLPDWDSAPPTWAWEPSVSLPEGDEGFMALLEAANSLPEHQQLLESLKRVEERPEGWVQEAQELFQGSERVFELLALALVHDRMTWPSLSSLDAKMPYLDPVQRLATFLRLRARTLLALGLPEQSIQLAWQMLEVGQRLEDGKGLIVHLKVAQQWKVLGLESLQELLGPQGLPAKQFPDVSLRLKGFWPASPSLLGAFRGEFHLFAKKLKELEDQNEAWNLAGLGHLLPLSGISYFFQPNRTLALFSDFDQAIQKQLEKPCGSQLWLEKWQNPEIFGTLDWIRPNALGRLLFQQQKPALANVFWMRCEQQTRIEAVRTLYALAAFEARESDLPNHLNLLVPDFFQNVPVDWLSGEPLFFEASRRLVWSPGFDLQNDGGVAPEDLLFHLPSRPWAR